MLSASRRNSLKTASKKVGMVPVEDYRGTSISCCHVSRVQKLKVLELIWLEGCMGKGLAEMNTAIVGVEQLNSKYHQNQLSLDLSSLTRN